MEEELGQVDPLVIYSYDSALRGHSPSREADRGRNAVFYGACDLNGLMTGGDRDRLE